MRAIGYWRASLGIALLLAGMAGGGAARAGDPQPTLDGTCSTADFRAAWGGAAVLPATQDQYQTGVLRQGVSLYANRTGTERRRVLRFNEKVYVRADDRERLGVALEGEHEVAGWVNRADLLCNRQPLESRDNRLERTGIISPSAAGGSDAAAGTIAFTDPDFREAGRRLSRFRLYFIAAERGDAFLLAESAVLQSSRGVLVGWVDRREVTEWTTRLGLRGAERPSRTDQPICGYLALGAMRARYPTDCQKIAAGPEWFETENRMLVLSVAADHYEVFGPVGGDLRRLYVPTSEDVEIDVLMRLGQLDTWTDIFRPLLDADVRPVGSLRKWYVDTLIRSLETVAGEPTYYSVDEKLSQYVRRTSGLPMGIKSVLLDYSVADLRDPGRVPECELRALIDWARASRQMLKWAQSGDKLARVDLRPVDPAVCRPSAGRQLLVPASKVEAHSLDHRGKFAWPMFNETLYWVPQSYLP